MKKTCWVWTRKKHFDIAVLLRSFVTSFLPLQESGTLLPDSLSFLVIECTSGYCYWSFLRALGEIHFGPICKQSYAYHPQLYNESWGCFLTLLFAKCHWSCHKIRLTQIGPCAQSVETHDTISFLAPLYFLWLSLGSNQVKTMNRSKMNQ